MPGPSRIGGAPSVSHPPAPQEAKDGQPPTFKRTRTGSDTGASDDTAPSAKRSRRASAPGLPARQTTASTQPPVTARPSTQAQAMAQLRVGGIPGTPGYFHLSSDDHVLLGHLNAPMATSQAQTTARFAAAGNQTGTTHQQPTNLSAATTALMNAGDSALRNLLSQPRPPRIAPSPPAASGTDHPLISMLAQPYVDAELTQLQSMRGASTASTTAPRVAMPLPASGGAQGAPVVPMPVVPLAPVTAGPSTSAASQPGLATPFDPGLAAGDWTRRDTMDEYLQGVPAGQIPVPTVQDLVQGLFLPGPGSLAAGVAPQTSAGQHPGAVPAAWVNPLPQPMPMPSATQATPASNPAAQNPPAI